MKPVVLVVRDEQGEPRPAVRSIFPDHESDLEASSFESREQAERFAREVLAPLGCATRVDVVVRWGTRA